MAAGGGGGGSAVKAGQAFVELLGKDSGLARALDRAQAKVKAFGQTVAQVGAGVTAGGAAVLAPIAGLFNQVVERGSTLDNLARQLGGTVEEVSALGYAFESVGLKTEDFADVMKTLDQKISHAMDGNDEAVNTFRRLGLSFNQLARMAPAERLDKVGALNRIALGSDKTEFAMKLLGGQGAKTLRIFEQGPGALQALMGKAGDVGAVMSTETAAGAMRVGRAFTEMWSAGKYALTSIAEALLPQAGAIEEFSRRVVSAAKEFRKWVAENKVAIQVGVAVAAGVAAAGVALTGLGLGLSVASTAASGFFGVLVVLKGAVAAALSPLGLAAAAVGALGYAFATQTESGRALAAHLGGELAGAWRTAADAATQAWGGISSAVRRGDIAGAGRIALAALEVVFRDVLERLLAGWQRLTDPLIEPFLMAKEVIVKTWEQVVARSVSLWNGFTGLLGGSFGKAVAAILPGIYLLGAAWKGLTVLFSGGFTEAMLTIREAMTNVIAYIQKSFVNMIAEILTIDADIAGALGADKLAKELRAAASAARETGRLIEASREAVNLRRRKELGEAAAGAREGRGGALDEFKRKTEEAKAALDAVIARERGAAAGGGGWDFKDFKIPDWLRKSFVTATEAADPARVLASSAKGGFNVSAANVGIGNSVLQRQVGLQQDANKKLDAIEKAIQKIKIPELVFGD